MNISLILVLIALLVLYLSAVVFNIFILDLKEWEWNDDGSFLYDLAEALMIALPVLNWAVAITIAWYKWVRDPMKAIVEG